ncbi:MAG: polyphosphate kinase 2 [Alphaproteobacteria bacterium]|nr:polyphosphate kinase 2 [Alphaproteobacteria bacterium]
MPTPRNRISDEDYEKALYHLQVELVCFQRDLIAKRGRVLVLIEGRDGAGKDGTIKRIVEHLSPRETRVVALPKPSDREQSQWYFQRFIAHLPAASEFVLFNRSWYNRAGVEPVMGFCTPDEVEEFYGTVIAFEAMLVRSGIRLFKYYLDIGKEEQRERLAERRKDPLKQWKVSPIDAMAMKKWSAYSKARDEMFRRSNSALAPWRIVRADNKKLARLNLIRDLLLDLPYRHKKRALLTPDPQIVLNYYDGLIEDGIIAP